MDLKNKRLRKVLISLIILLVIPLTIYFGSIVFGTKKYAFITFAVTVLSLVPFFISFEKKTENTMKITMIATMTALSVFGRLAFSFFPFFKPVTAIVIICGMFLGAEAGFLCGALTALISNFYFGQGAFTPLMMFAWGIVGFFAGILSGVLRKKTAFLLFYGVIGGVGYSLLVDIWSVIWQDGYFNFSRYVVLITAALPMTVMYAVSNVIFLLLLSAPFGRKLARIKEKYGV